MKTKTPRELYASEISDWIGKLEALGADLSPLAAVREQVKLTSQLQAKASRLRRDLDQAPRTPVEAAARRIAQGENYDADGVRIEVLSAAEVRLELDAHEIAVENAGARAFQMLAARKDANLDLLRPIYLKAAAEMVALREVLGVERITLDEAARDGNAQAWLDLEARHAVIKDVREIHAQWLVDGIVRKVGARSASHGFDSPWLKYQSAEFYYTDRMVAHAAKGVLDMFKQANLFAAAGASLRSLADIDHEWPRSISDNEYGDQLSKAYSANRTPTQWDADVEAARAKWMQSTSIKLPGS